jgi:hypothetical protein
MILSLKTHAYSLQMMPTTYPFSNFHTQNSKNYPQIHVNFLEFFDIYKLRIHKPSQTSPFPIDIPFDISPISQSPFSPQPCYTITLSRPFPPHPFLSHILQNYAILFAKLCNFFFIIHAIYLHFTLIPLTK